jgi:hypothetical protein
MKFEKTILILIIIIFIKIISNQECDYIKWPTEEIRSQKFPITIIRKQFETINYNISIVSPSRNYSFETIIDKYDSYMFRTFWIDSELNGEHIYHIIVNSSLSFCKINKTATFKNSEEKINSMIINTYVSKNDDDDIESLYSDINMNSQSAHVLYQTRSRRQECIFNGTISTINIPKFNHTEVLQWQSFDISEIYNVYGIKFTTEKNKNFSIYKTFFNYRNGFQFQYPSNLDDNSKSSILIHEIVGSIKQSTKLVCKDYQWVIDERNLVSFIYFAIIFGSIFGGVFCFCCLCVICISFIVIFNSVLFLIFKKFKNMKKIEVHEKLESLDSE